MCGSLRHGAVHIVAGKADLVEISFKGLGGHVPAFGDAGHLRGDQIVDVGPRVGELLQVSFQRTLKDVAAFRQLLDLRRDQTVDAGAQLRSACPGPLPEPARVHAVLLQAFRPVR